MFYAGIMIVKEPDSKISFRAQLYTLGRASLALASLQGELSFEQLLRVDGSFKGKLTSTGDLVIGANGVIRGDIIGLREVRT